MTSGRVALLAVLSIATRVDLARRLRCKPQAVSQWASGSRRPAYAARISMQAELGIDPDAWDEQNETPVSMNGANLGSMRTIKRHAVAIPPALDARIARLRHTSAIAGALPSTASLVAALVARGVEAVEAELGVTPSTPPPAPDPH